MAEIGFLCVIAALLVFIVILEVIHVKERRTMLHAIIARSPSELRSLNQTIDAPAPPRPEPSLTDEEREFWAHGEPIGL